MPTNVNDPAADAAGQANQNIVYVKNSNIDYGFDDNDGKGGPAGTQGPFGFFWSDAGDGQSIYGGYSSYEKNRRWKLPFPR